MEKMETVKDMGNSIESTRVEQPHQSTETSQYDVIEELWWVGKGKVGRDCEDWIPSRPCAEDAIANDRGDQRGNDGLDFEIIFVENFSCQDRSSQWCAEDCADACSNTGR